MSTHIVISGGGPGVYVAALVAAQKGLKVTLIEHREIGGTCLNRRCIPTKALLTCSDIYSLLAHSAMVQGMTAAFHISGEDIQMKYDAIPNCVYCHPEIASVGLREGEVENPEIAKIPYRALGRAHPTFSEIYSKAFHLLEGRPIHYYA